jgi:general secretion pathway protein K
MNRRSRGVALLLVIWLLAVLTLTLGSLVTVVRQELQLSRWQREHTRAVWAAQAGLALAVRALREPQPERRWIADGRLQLLSFEGTTLQLRVRSERGKLDLNLAASNDLARLALQEGATAEQAQALAAALAARRLESAPPLRTLEELRPWAGMSEVLYQRMAPQLTLWSGVALPEPAFASPALREALGLAAVNAQGVDPGPVFSVEAIAVRPDGFSAVVSSTVLLSIEQSTRPFRVLRYSE